MRKRILLSLLGATPVVLMGFSTGPPLRRTGAAIDGGLNCTACHRTFAPANSDSRGGMRIDISGYTPGVKQTIRVSVAHPEALRWGFQLTARLASDETQTAGEFSASDIVKVMCDNGTQLGSAAPCQASQLQFAVHASAPRTEVGAGFTFTVDWTPPATNVGDIVFYGAGNAADGAANANDRIFTAVRRISPPCNLTAKPAISRAVNGASFGAPWNSGALMSIFGSNFGPTGLRRAVTEGDIVSRRMPQALGCIAVTVNGQNAPINYVQPDQINLQAPALAGIGPATIVVIANPGTSNEVRSDPFSLTTQQALAPALFTFDGKSVAAALATGELVANPALIPGAAAAKPGDIVVLFGTGLGATNPAAVPGEIAAAAASLTAPVTFTIGGAQLAAADILYAGLAPLSMPGVFQFNLRLPATLADGDLPVLLATGGVQSAAGTTIPVKR